MPVLVTAAERPLARLLVARLLEFGGEVRAYAAGDVGSLRAQGAIVATGTADDEARLEAALADVHTVVHLGSGLLVSDLDRMVADAETLATAAANAAVARIIALSLPGASAGSGDQLRRAYGHVEAIFAACNVPSIVVRPSLVLEPATLDALMTSGFDHTHVAAAVAPVRREDLVELLVALDDARSRATQGHLVTSADGPEVTTLGDLLVGLGMMKIRDGVVEIDLVGRELVDACTAAAMLGALAGPWTTDDPVVVDAWTLMGVEPTPPHRVHGGDVPA